MKLTVRLKAILKIIEIVEVPDFDIAKPAKKRQIEFNNMNVDGRNMLALKRRLQNCIESAIITPPKSGTLQI